MSRRFLGSAVALLLLTATDCGGGHRSCLARPGTVTRTPVEQIVRFPNGSRVIVAFARNAHEAALLAPASGGPGDPYGFVAFGSAILAWRGAADNPHLRAVERYLS